MRHKKVFTLLIAIIGIIASSCTCETFGDGIVYDAVSKKPLENVIAKSYIDKAVPSYKSEMTTDSTGFFTGSTGSTTGGFAGCDDLLVEFVKDGYVTQRSYNPQAEDIYLQPTE